MGFTGMIKRVGFAMEGEVEHRTADGRLICKQQKLDNASWLLKFYEKMRIAYAEKCRRKDIPMRYRSGSRKHNVLLEIIVLLLRRMLRR
jgi:hypothetical protein